MKILKTKIEDVLVIEPTIFSDHRGWFAETYSKLKLKELGINNDFVQDNHSFSKLKGTIRGLHCQVNPKAQTKLIRCTRGRILDVAVDLRKGSPTYKEWVSVELSDENHRQVLIPKGFAHGFLALTSNVEVQYKVDEYYFKEFDRSIRFDDPEIGINWGVENPILSEKDINAPLYKDSNIDFTLKILVTGMNGQLGHDVVNSLKKYNYIVVAPSREEFDITDDLQVKEYVMKEKPDVIIHCAAYTAVDKAEEEKQLCYLVNVDGTRYIAEAARLINSKVVYISTDYVFDGKGQDPHFEEKATNPINYYGFTKEQGEKIIRELIDNHFIVRTSWLYGINGENFVKTMLNLAESRKVINVVSDQVGSPTYSKDLADFIVDLIQTNKYGTYHGVNEGYCTWSEFAKSIFAKSKKVMIVNSITTDEFTATANRPLNSKLSKENTGEAGLNKMPHWEDALSRFIEEIKGQEE